MLAAILPYAFALAGAIALASLWRDARRFPAIWRDLSAAARHLIKD